MTKKAVALYLASIGLLLIVAIGWYVYAFLSQPEPESATPTFASTESSYHTPMVEPVARVINPPVTLTSTTAPAPIPFDGARAYADVITQVEFGPRVVGTESHAAAVEWIRGELLGAGWQVEIQESEALGHPIKNIVAMRSETDPQIIIGAHYDSRLYADQDPDPAKNLESVPGANDGASGVAVLLELARTLPADTPNTWLVFFDAEDNGKIDGWNWILGSREFVANNIVQPQAVVVVDMIGDADLNIYKEYNSNPALVDEIWLVAADLGYEKSFIPEYKHSMLDDHTPFNQADIPAVDLIDFDYPYWHTTQDTADKVSAASLAIVGNTLWTWITHHGGQ